MKSAPNSSPELSPGRLSQRRAEPRAMSQRRAEPRATEPTGAAPQLPGHLASAAREYGVTTTWSASAYRITPGSALRRSRQATPYSSSKAR